MKTYTFHVTGTHCASCKILIEDILMDSMGSPQDERSFVKSVRVNLKREIVEIETDSEKSQAELVDILNEKIKSHKYSLTIDKSIKENKKDDVIWKALPIGILFLVLFFWLQKSGVLNFGIGGQTTPTTSFIIGLIASVSSCLAIVGGLVLSLSAKVAQDDDNAVDKRNFTLFHIGRIASFALLGGA